ncbi:MAG: hypothetical protein HOY76_30450 [Streptomyces sp.]|nr:hypothetical protein [Streptomyces sp.]NUS14999.1 hypothetical protein [Streptomyces sp.]
MRMKRMAGAVAAGTLAMAGLGIAGATSASATVWTVSCSSYHQAMYSTGFGYQYCYQYDGGPANTVYVGGPATVYATGSYSVKVTYRGGYTQVLTPGQHSDYDEIDHFVI